MYKKITIYLVVFLFSGCSVFKFQNKENSIKGTFIKTENLRSGNLTNYSFYIQKIDVELNFNGERRSFLASVKYSKPATYLISLRSKTGIEAARIFIKNDSLMINDRINKTLFYGSGKDIVRKYGFDAGFLPVLFGDFVISTISERDTVNCNNGVLEINSNYRNKRLKYSVDCYSERISGVEIENETESNPIIIKYSDDIKKGEIRYYAKIQIFNLNDIKEIYLKLSRIEIPYSGIIEFVPGRDYQQVRIK